MVEEILGLFDRLLLILDRLRAPVGKPFRRDFSKTRESNRWQKVSATSELKIKNEFLGYLSQKVNEFEQIWSSFVRYTGSIQIYTPQIIFFRICWGVHTTRTCSVNTAENGPFKISSAVYCVASSNPKLASCPGWRSCLGGKIREANTGKSN